VHLRKESMQPSGTSEQWVAWLTSPDEDLWKHATMALGGLQPGDNVAVEPLIHALRASKAGVVFWCVIGLGCLGKGAKEAVPELIRIATEDPQFGTRQAALYALSKVGQTYPA
jgi:HEAT repeat protein